LEDWKIKITFIEKVGYLKQQLFFLLLVLSFFSCNTQTSQKGASRDEIASILKENPEIILDAMKGREIELFEIAQKGAIEKQQLETQKRRNAELKNPKVPFIEEGRLFRGKQGAKVTIVEYSDFECPFCAKGAMTVKAVLEKYGDNIRFVYKHNPLSFHKQALPAAMYFEAIGMQSQEEAWKFHDMIFSNQDLLKNGESGFQKLISRLKIDKEKLKNDYNGKAVAGIISSDMAEAKKFGFGGTPTFLVNGITITGAQPEGNFAEIIDFLLKESM